MTSMLVFVSVMASASPAEPPQPAWQAKWIWRKEDSYKGYNDTIDAHKTFDAPANDSAHLRITADTIYRLYVNDAWVNDGPCRSWPDHYQYDVIDVAPYLHAGKNEIHIIAKYFGVGTFHQIPQQAGLLAQLDIKTKDGKSISIATDETWEVAQAAGWVSNTPKRCIQMGPLEVYDARREVSSKAEPAAVLFAANAGPWKGLNPRDCPLLTRIPFPLRAFREANIVRPDWSCVVVPTARLLYPGQIEANGKVSMASGMATEIVAEKPMTIHLDSPGCTITVNGDKGKDGAFALNAGPNFLFDVVTSYFGHWHKDSEIRFVDTKGYTLRNPVSGNTADPWCFAPFDEAKYVSTDYEYPQLPEAERKAIEKRIEDALAKYIGSVKDAASLKQAFGDKLKTLSTEHDLSDDPHWQFVLRQPLGGGKENVENPGAITKDGKGDTTVRPAPNGDVELVYDLGEENIGFYQFAIDAEAGLTIDVSAVEYIAPDGRVQHTGDYRNVMRYVCKEGANHFTSIDRRAGRFLFITLRHQTKPAIFHSFRLIESTYPVQPVGKFACSEPDLDHIWEISARTLKLCMEDTFTDCPLYEQTHWVGDARNEGVFGLTAFGASDLAKRCVALTGNSMEKYPIALCQTPSTWGTLLPAWSFLWGISVWDYYDYSGDKAFLERVWPQVMLNLHGAQKYTTDHGLFSAPFWNMFDWSGIDDNHNTVTHNSMFIVGAIDAALHCADVLGDKDAEKWLKEYRASLVTSINALWDAKRGVYPDSLHEDGTPSKSASVHTSFLALLYDIAEPANHAVLLDHALHPPDGMVKVGSPFAMMYLYEALDKAGKQDAIVDSIREIYKPMLTAGATTVWESFPTGTTGSNGFPTRSHCHAWSSAPVHFLNRIVLGIVQTEPAGKRYTISPRLSGLTWAKGTSATINGPVEVAWERKGDAVTITAKGPQGIPLEFAANDSLKGLKVTFNGKPVS